MALTSKRFLKSVFTGLTLAATSLVTKAAQISCPILQCTEPQLGGAIDYDLCLKIDETQPMTVLRSYDCDWYIANEKSNLEVSVMSTCDFSANEGKFAWVNEAT